jgi:dihydroorotate dehydrogenase electron transfer subunit
VQTKKTFQLKARLIVNARVKGVYWHCILAAQGIAQQARPGQFVHIRLGDSHEPLLRRPFSIHKVNGSTLEILYQVVGQGTAAFSRKKAGEYLDIIGPLGNGFGLLSSRPNILIVAGGMGVAPLVFFAKGLAQNTKHKTQTPNKVLIGATTKVQILCEKDFIDSGYSVKIATDDGSRGFKGYVSELLKQELLTMDYRLSAIYACGPKQMLKEVAAIGCKYDIPAQISLEEHMACGVGACLGCAVNTRGGFKCVCKEGPVFDAAQIIW